MLSSHVSPLTPLELDEEAVAQHHDQRVPVKGVVSPPQELVPAQELLSFLVVLLDPPPAVTRSA